MTTAMRKIADGDLTAEIPALGRTDEIGSMAKAVQVFKDNAIEKQRLEAAAKAEAEHQREAAEAQRKLEEAAGAEVARVVSAARPATSPSRSTRPAGPACSRTCRSVNSLLAPSTRRSARSAA